MSFETMKQKNIEIVTDPKRIRALIDENRLEILRALREGIRDDDERIRNELTIPEIASKLGKKSPNLYHHADVLVETGFLEIARQETKKRSSITYYRRTKPVFVIAYDPEQEMPRDIYDKPLMAELASSFGLNKDVSEKLHEMMREYRLYRNKALQKVTNEMEELQQVPISQEFLYEAVTTLADIYLHLDEEFPKLAKEFLNLLGFKGENTHSK